MAAVLVPMALLVGALIWTRRMGAPASITTDSLGVHVRPRGPFLVWALSGTITIPWGQVRLAWVETDPERPRGLRFPGTYIPGAVVAGSYVRSDGRELWCWKPGGDALVIETDDFHWVNLVIGVDEPHAAAASILRGQTGAT